MTHVHRSLGATADTYGAGVLGVRENDLVYSAAKIFFAYGFGNAMTFPMSVGATTLLFAGRPTPDGVIDILAGHHPTLFCGVPTLFSAMLAQLEAGDVPDTALRLCISAGEALPEATGKGWRAKMGVDILDGVGSTEMLHILSNREAMWPMAPAALRCRVMICGYRRGWHRGRHWRNWRAVGRRRSGAEGYWISATRAAPPSRMDPHGDEYERRADGRYIYCGRTDDLFKVSGIWVSPFEVEQSITAHDAVVEAAVVAAADDDGLLKPRRLSF